MSWVEARLTIGRDARTGRGHPDDGPRLELPESRLLGSVEARRVAMQLSKSTGEIRLQLISLRSHCTNRSKLRCWLGRAEPE